MARTKSSNAWLKRHVNDPYVRRAQVEGFRSRAAYKLLQIAERDRLLAPGMVVVDLGATPGGWSQVAAKAVGARGAVIALDILEMEPLRGVTFLRGDFEEDAMLAVLESELGGRAVDLVLSDMAPNMSGIPSADQARVMGLAELARDFAINHLKPNGNFLVKVFHGAGFDDFLKSLRAAFRQVVIRKPDASRRESSEVYLLARGRR